MIYSNPNGIDWKRKLHSTIKVEGRGENEGRRYFVDFAHKESGVLPV